MKKLILAVLVVMSFSTMGMANDIKEIELTPPPVDMSDVNRIWHRLLKEIDAPNYLLPPPIVIDWEVPIYARMGFQYPTEEFPDNRI